MALLTNTNTTGIYSCLVQDKQIKFKIDTVAEVNIMTKNIFDCINTNNIENVNTKTNLFSSQVNNLML